MHRDPLSVGLRAFLSAAGAVVLLLSLAFEHRPYRIALLLLIAAIIFIGVA